MTPEVAVHIVKQALLTTFWLAAPLLLIGFIAGIIINLVQVATSLQDAAFSSVPRLAAFLLGALFLLPWMVNKLMAYTVSILGELPRYAK